MGTLILLIELIFDETITFENLVRLKYNNIH